MTQTDTVEIDDAQEQARQLVADIIERTGLTASEVARRAGIAPSTLTRIYPVPTVSYTLSGRTLAKLVTAFPSVAGAGSGSVPRGQRHAQPGDGKLPIFALHSARGGAALGALELYQGNLEQPIGVRGLIGTDGPGRYCMAYMPSDCMEPRIRAGEVILIDRLLPPATGSDVLVEWQSGDAPALLCIGQLTRRTRGEIEISQFQGNVVSVIDAAEVKALYTIVGRFDRALIG